MIKKSLILLTLTAIAQINCRHYENSFVFDVEIPNLKYERLYLYKIKPDILVKQIQEKLEKLGIKNSLQFMEYMELQDLNSLHLNLEVQKIYEKNPNIDNELKTIYKEWHENQLLFTDVSFKEPFALPNILITQGNYKFAEILLFSDNIPYLLPFFEIKPNVYYKITLANQNN